MSSYGNHRFEWGTCSACGVTEEALQDNIASKWCTNYQPTPWGRFGMLAHWAAILFLCGAPLAGLIGAIPAAMIAGAVGMLVAELHAGLFDEIIEHFAGLYASWSAELDEYEAEMNFVERED